MTFDNRFLNGLIVGISISESPDIARFGFSQMHLLDTMVEVARYLLASGAKLGYGGDPEYGGLNFLDTLVQLAKHHNRDYQSGDEKRLYLGIASSDIDTQAELQLLATFVKVDPLPQPADNGELVEKQFVRARHLTLMREEMNQKIDARIILGGRTEGFAGSYPGLVEEAYLALKADKGVFLMGAFGGCSKVIIEAVQGQTPEALTEAHQSRDLDYANFVSFYNQKAATAEFEPIDYGVLVDFLADRGIAGLNNGLSCKENKRLFETTRLTEMISLILKGLKAICP